MSAEDIVNAYFRAVEQGDVAGIVALVADDFRIWHSFSDAEQGANQITDQLGPVLAHARMRYELQEQAVLGDRVFRRHYATITTSAGDEIRFPIAVFFTVRGGRITRCEEYVDGSALARVGEAIGRVAA